MMVSKLFRIPAYFRRCKIYKSFVSGTELNAVGDQLSDVFSLLLDPAEEDEDEEAIVYDAGDFDDRLPPPCPGCGKVFKGTSEKGRKAFISNHIRLHNLQGKTFQKPNPSKIL